MNLRYIDKNSEHSSIFTIHDLVKHSKPGKPQPALGLPRFTADDTSCVPSTPEDYIQRTKSLRGNEEQLCAGVIQPHNKVSNNSISLD